MNKETGEDHSILLPITITQTQTNKINNQDTVI